MLKIGIITGSTRPNRNSLQVAEGLKRLADPRGDAEYEVIDIATYNLPMYAEPISAAYSQNYVTPEAIPWSKKIAEMDGYVFITPEYNHGVTSALKNAIDYLYPEWNNKAAGIVSYGSTGGVRAAEALRVILAELQIADVRTHPAMSLFTDFENMSVFTPADIHRDTAHAMLDQVIAWSTVLKPLREKK
ncbi:nadph-dependent fmn reductase [Trichococcus palustris]|jgi:NAD(P)H-dependent FMN reductase|uniref:Nadph-dependent fmn reductase n=1 Tax=Trichococcus palustris TaxID=140314 RepID=A0A143YVH6_9LACT|nr:NAD(P)H-dependent oxidoreductase [Trichococcus palustris]CZQ97770.1 nadph-dependent fmn reductase [Trichococcus palustris]SFL10314.1 NAD(P)H-dependent FMN reductase [Trichococcus palustris]